MSKQVRRVLATVAFVLGAASLLAAGANRLPDGVRVMVSTDQELSSASAHTGESIAFTVAEDAIVDGADHCSVATVVPSPPWMVTVPMIDLASSAHHRAGWRGHEVNLHRP